MSTGPGHIRALDLPCPVDLGGDEMSVESSGRTVIGTTPTGDPTDRGAGMRRPSGRPRRRLRSATALLATTAGLAGGLFAPAPVDAATGGAAAISATGGASATAAIAATPPALPQPDAFGIDTVSWVPAPGDENTPASQWRLVDATMTTGAVYRSGATPQVKVRILVPPNYDPGRATPYRTLWLLHGGAGTYEDWTNMDVRQVVADSAFDGIVVMPEAGSTGYYTDWWGEADNGASPAWETFHIDQLVPWVDANFNTDASRHGRAIAGLSMGGWGALTYAGQHPDLFSAVGSFSGATNIRLRDTATGGSANVPATISQHMWLSGACILNTNCLDFGFRVNLYEGWWPFPVSDPARQEAYRMETLFGPESNYANINPWDLAGAYASYGGNVGIYTGGETSGERDMYAHATSLRGALDSRGIDYRWCAGDGTHSASFWKLDLIDFLAFTYGTPIACHYDN